MTTSIIYLALPVGEPFFKNKELVSLFVSNSSDYLSQFYFNDRIYWGKKATAPVSLETLESVGRHILSLVTKIHPDHALTLNDLVIFPDVEAVGGEHE